MANKIGAQIRRLLVASEEIGYPVSARTLFSQSNQVALATNMTRVCRRAVAYGLMTADETVTPIEFGAAQGWECRLCQDDANSPPKQDPKKAPRFDPARMVNSVWSLGR